MDSTVKLIATRRSNIMTLYLISLGDGDSVLGKAEDSV